MTAQEARKAIRNAPRDGVHLLYMFRDRICSSPITKADAVDMIKGLPPKENVRITEQRMGHVYIHADGAPY